MKSKQLRSKRWMLVVMLLVLLVSFVGCSPKEKTSPTKDENATTDNVTTEPVKEEKISYNPNGDVKIIVPSKTGGTADIVTRILARYLTDEIGQQVIVENKAGAGSLVALSEYLNEKPNTTKLQVFFNSPFTLDPLFGDVPVAMDDFQPIISMDANKRILYVNSAKTGIESYEDLLEYGKNNFIPYGSASKGNQIAIVQSGLYGLNNIEADLVIAKEVLSSLLGGHIVSAVDTPVKGASFVKEGSIKPILVFSDEPFIGFDGIEVPTAKSKGLDIVVEGFRFIGISKGTDQEIVDYWYENISNVFNNPDFIMEVGELGVEMIGGDQETIKETINNMYETHKVLVDSFEK